MSGSTSLLSPTELNDPWLAKATYYTSGGAPPQPVTAPTLIPLDQDATFGHVTIAGQVLPAMAISGEPRVPLELFKARVFTKYTHLLGLNAADDKLKYKTDEKWNELMEIYNVHVHTATFDQVQKLRAYDEDLYKERSITLQLLNRTDAERLIGLIRAESSELPCIRKSASLRNAFGRIPVCHYAVGDDVTKGSLFPARKGGRCIQCDNCCKWFTPEDFVVHSHDSSADMRTAHWGFCPSLWREMIVLSPDAMIIDHTLSEALEEFKIEDDQPSTSKRLAVDENEVSPKRPRSSAPTPVLKASETLSAVLEKVSKLPPINYEVVASQFDLALIVNNETKFREKATAEAMNGKIFDMGGSGKGIIQQADLQDLAIQVLRSQQPYLPDPEAFPAVSMPRGGSTDLSQILDLLKVLEQSYPDGKNSQAQQLFEMIRRLLQKDAHELQQQEMIYSTLLASYKMLSGLWRWHANPLANAPECPEFQDLAQNLATLDPMQFLGMPAQKNLINGVKTVPIPPAASIQKSPIPMPQKGQTSVQELHNMIQQIQTMQKNAVAATTSPLQKGADLPTAMHQNALLTMLNGTQQEMLIQQLLKNNSNGYFKAPMLPQTSPMKAASLLQPLHAQHLPTVPAGAGLLSPKLFSDPGRSEAVSRLQTAVSLLSPPFSQ